MLNVQRENFLAAESRIRDVDVAQEAGLVAARAIMQQVRGVSSLASESTTSIGATASLI